MVTVFTSPTCAPCKVAKKRLAMAGIQFVEVDLSTDSEALDSLKSRLDREHVQTPLFEYDGAITDMTGLRDLIDEASRG